MSRKNIITEIIKSFEESAHKFKEDMGANLCEIKSNYFSYEQDIENLTNHYYTRFRAYKIFYKKDYEKIIELDYITNTKRSDKFMKRLAIIILFLSIAFTFLTVKTNVKFEENGFIDNSKFFSIRGDYYPYSKIEKFYYKPIRVNDFNETLNNPSYVIVLKSGKEIDLYQLEDYKKSEEFIIPIMIKNNISVYYCNDNKKF